MQQLIDKWREWRRMRRLKGLYIEMLEYENQRLRELIDFLTRGSK